MIKRIVSVTTLLVAGMVGAAWAAAPAGMLEKSQVLSLIQTAQTSADHTKLANYYRLEAKRLQAEVKEHEEMAAAYDKNPIAHPIPKGQTLGDHCRNLAKYYGEGAKDANEMAAVHDEMAIAALQ